MPIQSSKNMKIFRYILSAAVLVVAASSCSDKAQIKGTVTDAPQMEVVVKQLAGNSFNVLDTLTTDKDGKYSFKMDIAKGQPEFVYVFKGDTKLASLILMAGDNVKVVSDSLGKYSVEGSEESARLQQVETEFSAFLGRMSAAAASGDNAALSREYVDYYRSRVAYVMNNAKSLTAIPVLYQKINDNFPVFSQSTDALHFSAVHDSLATVYPDSKYVTMLGEEARKRTNILNINMQIKDLNAAGYPDVELPSIDGKTVKLSDVDSKVTLVYFWTAVDPNQKMFNKDVLLPVYNEYHSRGFEIYSISLDTDKGVWASAVKNQNLPWVNVCDGLGSASKAAALYNVNGVLPIAFMIVDGALSDKTVQGEKDLRNVLSANL